MSGHSKWATTKRKKKGFALSLSFCYNKRNPKPFSYDL